MGLIKMSDIAIRNIENNHTLPAFVRESSELKDIFGSILIKSRRISTLFYLLSCFGETLNVHAHPQPHRLHLLSFTFYLVFLLRSAHRFPGRGRCGSGAHLGVRLHLQGYGVGDRRRETGDRRKEENAWTAVSLLFFCLFFLPSPCLFLTIQPNVVVRFAHERAEDYYGITVKGTLVADGRDSARTILFTSGAEEWARKPGDWRGIEASPLRLSRTVEASSDGRSVIRYCRIEYANVGIKADGSSPPLHYAQG